MANGIQQYTRLEHRLVLLAWLNSLLGYESNKELLSDCKDVAEGFASNGHSYLYHHLLARGGKVSIPEGDLARYDENIRSHLEKINRHRPEPITLRYFQDLAALYTEIVLDRLFNHRAQLLADLNDFVKDRNKERNKKRLPGEPQDEPFTEEDLTKLAYWMATGSGKTLILHLNYYQFMHYNRKPLDNILLITPNESLSEQHLRELEQSGIPARRFDLNQSGLFSMRSGEVQVIEITKLVEEKRGSGVSVPVDAFEGYNLIFVDEGHKGSGGEKWRRYREALGQTGFTFEYSATFGQALSAAGKDDLTAEYGKTIIFDYSYRYFYTDGFGKDFRILNLKDGDRPEVTETLLLGNLLSFYEQLRLYEEQSKELRPYNLEKPLWVFVGSTVNAVYSENRRKRSDVLTVARFLHRVLSDQKWVNETISNLLQGKSGLLDTDGKDVFADRFQYLKDLKEENREDARAFYRDILQRVFHAPGSGGLHLADIRGSSGEIGLKAAGAEDYFGVIYIGDTPEFKKLVAEQTPEIVLEEDAIGGSLFDEINRPDSHTHVLIGARKFMEGWNSWRVSSMGLLNIGRQEGSQIIQLFGRGVRLKGKEMSLRRSTALDGKHPKYIKLLETLNIFAVRADYMAQFRNYLEREGIEVEPPAELRLPVRVEKAFLQRGLVIPRLPEGRNFASEVTLLLEPDASLSIRMDLSARVEGLESTSKGLHTAQWRGGEAQSIPRENLALVDWQQLYLDLLTYKERRRLTNLLIHPEVMPQILEHVSFKVVAEESVLRPNSLSDWARLQEIVTHLLRRYVDKFYQKKREQWEEKKMVYRLLDEDDPNLAFNSPPGPAYSVKIPRSEEQLIQAIARLAEDLEHLYRQESGDPPRIHFDRHIYIPLLLEKEGLMLNPPGLNRGETQFVRDLRDYWNAEKDKSLKGREIFLLRNLSRGHGIGFFEERGFYPDFILWVLDQETKSQRIVFIEPHGMLHASAYRYDDKARLHEKLPDLAEKIGQNSKRKAVPLDAFVLSATPYTELSRRYDDGTWTREKFAEKHILFLERGMEYDYLKILLGR